jgi:hypothetical protein
LGSWSTNECSNRVARKKQASCRWMLSLRTHSAVVVLEGPMRHRTSPKLRHCLIVLPETLARPHRSSLNTKFASVIHLASTTKRKAARSPTSASTSGSRGSNRATGFCRAGNGKRLPWLTDRRQRMEFGAPQHSEMHASHRWLQRYKSNALLRLVLFIISKSFIHF